ncbi:putative secreted protein [Wickerhamomyces ciferrii]|uniref:Secreted protein n=1 Tax=Wickerhamomyces ciferrii (strain ATCC 14091 / BCRC 22168 / CBS 111 / JCM 3599 / NBRC 0793 / NRRL Y-1031 F-60-10) TaxID=1206466 RepID=K0KKU4_WICCF|nr:uncharacterized protein BN7_5406 [Wickerhamomyces ciferrii]CCH45820.1 putative secreted protein [Wickerhamomyces ciferrii]
MVRFTPFVLVVFLLSALTEAGVLLEAYDQLRSIINQKTSNCSVDFEVIYEVNNGFSIIIGDHYGNIDNTIQEVNAGVDQFIKGQEYFKSLAIFSSPHAFNISRSDTTSPVLRNHRDVAAYNSTFIDGIPPLFDSKIK